MRSFLDGAYGVPTRYRAVVLTVSKLLTENQSMYLDEVSTVTR
jgi:hypothetical protein